MSSDTPDSAPLPCPSRRAFCTTACALLAATVLRGQAPDPLPTERPLDPQPLKLTEVTRADLSPGKVLDYRKLGAFYLAADARGIFALTAICTHRGCLVLSEGAEGYGCPCHDSAYDFQGQVTEGPAKFPLRHLAVSEATPGGRLQVDTATPVPPETRL